MRLQKIKAAFLTAVLCVSVSAADSTVTIIKNNTNTTRDNMLLQYEGSDRYGMFPVQVCVPRIAAGQTYKVARNDFETRYQTGCALQLKSILKKSDYSKVAFTVDSQGVVVINNGGTDLRHAAPYSQFEQKTGAELLNDMVITLLDNGNLPENQRIRIKESKNEFMALLNMEVEKSKEFFKSSQEIYDGHMRNAANAGNLKNNMSLSASHRGIYAEREREQGGQAVFARESMKKASARLSALQQLQEMLGE